MEGNLIIGIDPGVLGGIALMGRSGKVIETRRMPQFKGKKAGTDTSALCVYLRALALYNPTVAVERVGYLGGGDRSGPQGIATLARTAGLLEGLCVGLQLSYVEVAPQTWQTLLKHHGVSKVKTPKTATPKEREADKKAWKAEIVRAAQRYWPTADLVGSTRGNAVPHSGIADALWICEYVRLTVAGVPRMAGVV